VVPEVVHKPDIAQPWFKGYLFTSGLGISSVCTSFAGGWQEPSSTAE